MTRRSFRLAAKKRKALRPDIGGGSRQGRGFEPIRPRPADSETVLSFGQERLWFLDQLEQGGSGYLLTAALRLGGPLNPAAFVAALATIHRRHEVLRTTFQTRAGRAFQTIAPPSRVGSGGPILPTVDLRRLPKEQRSAVALELARRESSRPMDLATGPLARHLLLRLDAEEHLLVVALHHIVTDGISTVVFLRELSQLYAAACEGRPSPLAPLELQYADFAAWQRRRLSGERLDSLLATWRQRLAGAPAVLELPTDRPRSAVRSPRGHQQGLSLPMSTVEALQNLGQKTGTTLFVSLLAVFAALLQRLSGQSDLVIGTPVAGRDRREIAGLIGFFVNTLVLRADLSGKTDAGEIDSGEMTAGEMTGQSLLTQLKTSTLAAFAHQEVPFEKLVEELKPARNLGHSPIFQVMFTAEGDAGRDPKAVDIPGLEARLVDLGREVANFDLSMTVQGSPDGFTVVAEYPTDLYDDTTVRRWLGYFETLLDGLVKDPERPLAELDLLSESERAQLLEWNETPADPGELVPTAFARQVAKSPQAVALQGIAAAGDEHTLDYADLASRVARLAEGLRAHGVGPEVRVGLCLERTTDLLVAVLAVLEAGGCYVPLDPDHPADRLSYVQVDAGVSLVLAEDNQAHLVAPGVERLTIEQATIEGLASPKTASEPSGSVVDPDGLAYILYTSGSTGRPKGVQISHRALANFLASMARQPGLEAGQTVLAVTTLGFDIASVELLLPLLVGAKVVLATGDEAKDGRRLARRLEDSSADVMQATPATWRQLLDAGWGGRPGMLALCGGEALPPELAERLLALEVELWNLYGPTETTVWSSVQRVESATSITLGRPIANTEIHVLDRGSRPVPLGVAGELHIGGLGLARGYRGRPGLTAERFVPDPFSGRAGARLYKTGDGCRRLPSGETDYLGRLDSQVKVRGFRIELGEIEAVLLDQPEVRVAAVTVRGGAGEGRLVAYVVPEPEMGDLGAQPAAIEETEPAIGRRLQSELERRLPSYMVPRQWIVLESLPLNPNGKIDRGALPDPRFRRGERVSVAPRDAIERQLVELWSELLETEVGVEDDFFELGGHSLTATRLLSALRDRFGVEISLRRFFEAPRIAALATVLRERGVDPAEGVPATPQPISKIRRVRRGSGAGQAGKNLARLLSRVESP